MADFGAPVAAENTYNPQQGLNTLGQIYGIETAKAQATLNKLEAKQQTGIAQWMQHYDPEAHTAADGTVDMNSILGDENLRKAAGTDFPQVIQHFLGIKQNQLQAKQQLVNLNDATRKQFQTILGGLRTDPDVIKGDQAGQQKIKEAIGSFAATSPDAARIAGIFGPVLDHTPPAKFAQTLSNMQLQAESASAQAASQAPQYQTTGTQLVNVNPQAAGAGGPMVPGASLTQSPTLSTNVAAVQNITQQAAADQKTYSASVTAGNEAPMTKNILKNIEILAGQTVTGPGSQTLADAETVLGQYIPGFSGATDAATKRQLLWKYVEQLAMRVTQANGYATDDARALVSHAIPNPNNMTPKAIQQAAKFIQSQTEISQARASFANNYMQTHGSSLGFQKADSQFMQNVDPRMFDYLSLPANQRNAWIKKEFGDNKEAIREFARKFRTVTELGGFNYQEQQ